MAELDGQPATAIAIYEMTYKAESVKRVRTGTFAPCSRVATPVMRVRHTCLSVTAPPFQVTHTYDLDGDRVVVPGSKTGGNAFRTHRRLALDSSRSTRQTAP